MFCENASLAAWQWQLCLPVLQLWNTKSVLINLKIALDSITNQPPLPFSCNRTRKLHKPASWKPRIPVDDPCFIRNECQFYKRRQPPPPRACSRIHLMFSAQRLILCCLCCCLATCSFCFNVRQSVYPVNLHICPPIHKWFLHFLMVHKVNNDVRNTEEWTHYRNRETLFTFSYTQIVNVGKIWIEIKKTKTEPQLQRQLIDVRILMQKL